MTHVTFLAEDRGYKGQSVKITVSLDNWIYTIGRHDGESTKDGMESLFFVCSVFSV